MDNHGSNDPSKRIQDLKNEVKHKEVLLQEKQQELQKTKQKRIQMESQLTAMKQSKLWIMLRKLKQKLKTAAAYITGRKNIKQLFKSAKQKQANKKMKTIKYKLYEQGFQEKALADLENIFETTDNKYLRRLSAWELALWHANQYSREGAIQSLSYIEAAKKGVKSKNALRKAAILKAECLERLNEIDEGKRVISQILANQDHPDLYLAAANLEKDKSERVKWINKALKINDIAPIAIDGERFSYDSLTTANIQKRTGNIPKVTVIIPAYNSENSIHVAIESILRQSWTNLELIIVDDCSTDNTKAVIQKYEQQDERVKVLSTSENSGPYVARNIALQNASGEFVTINDADDWSHVKKIEEQVNHLIENEEVIANTSEQARLTEDLMFYRRGKPGEYIFANMSSLMFRRKPVMETIGYWDCVRFGADGEFKRRLKKVFGDKQVVDLQTGPLSFQRQSSDSLTGSSKFGYHGFFMGARKAYAESYTSYHNTSQSLFYPFPLKERLFPVPEPMWPKREENEQGMRHFDVIIASEFRLLGGTNMSNIEEIKAQKKLGLRTGLVQLNRYDLNSVKEINPKVRELIDGEQVQVLVYGEKVTCDVLIVRHPPILQELQKYVPEIKARNVRVIINQPPKREYSEKGQTLYDIKQCVQNLKTYVGKTGKWHPIGPRIRETLLKHHSQALKSMYLSSEDWVNIIDVGEWKRPEHQLNKPVQIGRHSRDQYVKWPEKKEALLNIYPNSPDYEIQILGGAKAPKKVLGQLPENWKVYEFGEIEPKDFLANLDVFVYYTHPDWVEAFGRVIFEAMAAGVPVIIPPSYENLFGEAAIYAEPHEVQTKIKQITADASIYQEQVEKALMYVEEHFGHRKHARRLEDCMINDKLQ